MNYIKACLLGYLGLGRIESLAFYQYDLSLSRTDKRSHLKNSCDSATHQTVSVFVYIGSSILILSVWRCSLWHLSPGLQEYPQSGALVIDSEKAFLVIYNFEMF